MWQLGRGVEPGLPTRARGRRDRARRRSAPTRPPAARAPTATTQRTSPSSRASRRCASGPGCTSGRLACAACTIVYEVVDNSVDEAIAGYDNVTVTLHPDNSCTVVDNGRGIPVEQHAKEKRPAPEVVLTTLHAGAKFGEGGGYKVSGGLHGVGVSVVNALSERLHLEVRRDGHAWTEDFARGKPTSKFKKGKAVKRTGTTITFLPDIEVFDEVEFDFQTLADRSARPPS